jgi:CYTH domain-containing protein
LALEIERRFLVCGDGWRPHARWQRHLQQGYLVAAADGLTLRVRTARPLALDALAPGAPVPDTSLPGGPEPEAGGNAHLTLKAIPPDGGAGAALSRLEFEYPSPWADAEALLALCPARLSKCRYGLDLSGGDWVLDVFEDDNAPLVVAEVELEHPDQVVSVPPWCRREITGLHGLSNAALARHSLARWSEAERGNLLAGLG